MTPLRALLLVLVWSLPGLWCVGHAVAHGLEEQHARVDAAAERGDRITGLSQGHDHSHSHPERQPARSAETSKKLDMPMASATAVIPDVASLASYRFDNGAIGAASSSSRTVSGPRAPPVRQPRG